nr:hypothetical protein [Tanacetum cinerariifolium]
YESHPSPPTSVVGEMHKEAQQAAGGPTSLGATRHDASVDFTTEADPRIFALNDSIPSQQDEPIIVSNESEEEEEVDKDKDTHATSHDLQKEKLEQQKAKAKKEVALLKARPSFLDINQLTELLEIKELKKHVKDIEIELLGDLKEIPTKLENFTSTISSLTSQVTKLKNI